MAETRNIYQKMQDIKLELQKMDLKKSGQNKYAWYSYFELKDFLPSIVELMNKHGVFSKIDFTDHDATLRIVNIENPSDFVSYNSPVATLELKGCNSVQALWWVQTYLRRYLYMNAFDIVEADMFDAVVSDEDNRFKQACSDTNFMMKHDSCDSWLAKIRTKHAYNWKQEQILRNKRNEYINK